jgi:hypothetical protein
VGYKGFSMPVIAGIIGLYLLVLLLVLELEIHKLEAQDACFQSLVLRVV